MKGKLQFLLFVPVLIVYAIGMFNDVMEVDASQYAAMSREMLETGNFLQIYDRGIDYLDKPPLLFWLSTLSFKLFGVSNFSYKLPSVLFALLGLFSTYRLGKTLYNERVGFYAALILSSCQAWFLINHDIRTDTILAACTIFSIWQLYEFIQNNRLYNLFLGALGISGAMLTKGPIGIMVPVLALGFHLLVRREWKIIFNWRWLLIPPIVLALLSPMLVGLYQQYDLHPGKLIQNVPIQSGLQFYFWTQSFGRITGESVWKDDSTSLFFTHTFLWAFLPWCVLFLVGLWNDTKVLVLSRFKLAGHHEALTWGGFVFPFIAFSLSHYKLPHYIFILFPLAAIITGNFLNNLLQDKENKLVLHFFRGMQLFIAVGLFTLAFLLCYFAFPLHNIFSWSILVMGLILALFFAWKGQDNFHRVVMPSFIAVVVLNIYLNTQFYPSLFPYEASNRAAKMVLASSDESRKIVTYHENMYSLDFYSRQCVTNYENLSDLIRDKQGEAIWIVTTVAGYHELKERITKIEKEVKLDHYHISRLSIKFLNPNTRNQQLESRYLVKVLL